MAVSTVRGNELPRMHEYLTFRSRLFWRQGLLGPKYKIWIQLQMLCASVRARNHANSLSLCWRLPIAVCIFISRHLISVDHLWGPVLEPLSVRNYPLPWPMQMLHYFFPPPKAKKKPTSETPKACESTSSVSTFKQYFQSCNQIELCAIGILSAQASLLWHEITVSA